MSPSGLCRRLSPALVCVRPAGRCVSGRATERPANQPLKPVSRRVSPSVDVSRGGGGGRPRLAGRRGRWQPAQTERLQLTAPCAVPHRSCEQRWAAGRRSGRSGRRHRTAPVRSRPGRDGHDAVVSAPATAIHRRKQQTLPQLQTDTCHKRRLCPAYQ